MRWASQVTTICIEMVLPIVLGVWADRRLGTKFAMTLLGVAAGLWLGIWSLIRLGKTVEAEDHQGDNRDNAQNGASDDREDNISGKS
jgi:hypothetical protein